MLAGYIRLEDIPEDCQELAGALGVDAFVRMSALCGGMYLRIPSLERLRLGQRDRAIRSHFDGGNHDQLAQEYRLSPRQIRRIVQGART